MLVGEAVICCGLVGVVPPLSPPPWQPATKQATASAAAPGRVIADILAIVLLSRADIAQEYMIARENK
jgi:hypothetical protein